MGPLTAYLTFSLCSSRREPACPGCWPGACAAQAFTDEKVLWQRQTHSECVQEIMKMQEIDSGGLRSECAMWIARHREENVQEIRSLRPGQVSSAHSDTACAACFSRRTLPFQLVPWLPSVQASLLRYHLGRRAFPDHLISVGPHPMPPSPSLTPNPAMFSSQHLP